MEYVKMTKCKRCRRILKNPLSVSRGFGPICYEKIIKETQLSVDVKKVFGDADNGKRIKS